MNLEETSFVSSICWISSCCIKWVVICECEPYYFAPSTNCQLLHIPIARLFLSTISPLSLFLLRLRWRRRRFHNLLMSKRQRTTSTCNHTIPTSIASFNCQTVTRSLVNFGGFWAVPCCLGCMCNNDLGMRVWSDSGWQWPSVCPLYYLTCTHIRPWTQKANR